jgi:hypothetical protein
MGFYYNDELEDNLKTWELRLLTCISKKDCENRLNKDDFVNWTDFDKDGSNVSKPHLLKLFKGFIENEQDISYAVTNEYGNFTNLITELRDSLSVMKRNVMSSINNTIGLLSNVTGGDNSISNVIKTATNIYESGMVANTLKNDKNNSGGMLENDDYMTSGALSAVKFLSVYKRIYDGSNVSIGNLNVTAKIYTPEDYYNTTRRIRYMLPVEQYHVNDKSFADISNITNNELIENNSDGALYYLRPGKYSASDQELCTSYNLDKLTRSSGYILRIGNKVYHNLMIQDIKIESSHLKSVGYVRNKSNNDKIEQVCYPTMTTVSITLFPTDPIIMRNIIEDLSSMYVKLSENTTGNYEDS